MKSCKFLMQFNKIFVTSERKSGLKIGKLSNIIFEIVFEWSKTVHKMFEFNCIVENGAVRVCSQLASLKWFL